ncbi:hypothetical protein NECID01_0958 [Nematocida sp. AWRm77]|nr:hypothetical protein NECID01_0958 [Nematocida sp. AWRm77]
MHLQRTTLIAICVSLVCIAHSVTAMNNAELHEGVRKRANDQPSIDQFEGPTLTRHSMSTKEIKGSVAGEERKEKEEDSNTVLNSRVEWASKNQARVFKTVLVVAGLVTTIFILFQLIVFADAKAAVMYIKNTPISRYLFGYFNKYPSISYKDMLLVIEKIEAVETAQENEVVTSTMQTIIETTTPSLYNETSLLAG